MMAMIDGNEACSEVFEVADLADVTMGLDALILAAGFEDRAFRVLPDGTFSDKRGFTLS